METTDVHVAPGGGTLVDLGGLGVHFKLRGELTGGSFAIVEHPIEPGILVDPHVHRNEDEMSFVLDGRIWARVGDHEVEAVTGSYVWKPRGVLHTFWNPGPEPARILEIISPAGFERLFEQVAALLERSSETSEDEVCRISVRADAHRVALHFGWRKPVGRWQPCGSSAVLAGE
jgi:quercetin dioxygenase-like cupin family protein